MTKEELDQLQDLREEIRELEYKIARLRCRGTRVVSDKVQASSKEFPYTPTNVKITGIDFKGDERSRQQLTRKELLLKVRKQQAEEQELRITEYINTVGDSKIRRMMEYKYIEGYTWEKIGRLMHCDRTTAEKAVAKYLREHPEKK